MRASPRTSAAHFDHVLVDEYQDTNKLQADILHALKPDGAGLAVVGDDAQAIYSFRAAAVDNILDFPSASCRAPRSSRWRRTTAPRSRCSMPRTRSWLRRRGSSASICSPIAAAARGRAW